MPLILVLLFAKVCFANHNKNLMGYPLNEIRTQVAGSIVKDGRKRDTWNVLHKSGIIIARRVERDILYIGRVEEADDESLIGAQVRIFKAFSNEDFDCVISPGSSAQGSNLFEAYPAKLNKNAKYVLQVEKRGKVKFSTNVREQILR